MIKTWIRTYLEEMLPEYLGDKEWLTRKDIREQYGLGRKAIEQMESNGLPYWDGYRKLYKRTDLNRYLDEEKSYQKSGRNRYGMR